MAKQVKNKPQKFLKEKKEVLQKATAPKDNIPVVSQKKFNTRKTLFYVLLGSIVAAFGLLTFFVKRQPYFAMDLTITQEIQEFNPSWFARLMDTITYIGNPSTSVFMTALAVRFIYLKKRKREAAMLFFSVLGTTIVAQVTKALVHRPRPTPHLVHQSRQFLSNDSFPSGHVLFYIGFFGFLLFLTYTLPKEHRLRSLLLALFSILILLIGPSRIYEGAHWFSDVLGAYLVGFVCLTAIIFIYNRWQKKPDAS